jgi:Tfp pilus assembly protein PilW
MKNSRKGLYCKRRFVKGFSLIELMVTIAISIIPTSLIGVLLISGQYSWDKTYAQTNKQIEIEGQLAASIFGRVGRKATRNNCSFTSTSIIKDGSSDVIRATEVTFQYWCTGQITNTIVAETAKFYLSNNQLKVDYQRKGNPYTVVLANNVRQVEFSRNANQGCVRMVLKLQDVTDSDPYNETVTITAAAIMRG